MYKVIIAIEELGKHETFKEAFKEFYTEFKSNPSCSGKMIAETACWIEETTLSGRTSPIMLYECIDRAHREGLLSEDGKLTY